MNPSKLIKKANSKGDLARAVLQYQKALAWYADESHWAVTSEDDLIHAVAKVAMELGESWRLEHCELMDAHQAAMEKEGQIVWIGDDDPTMAAQVTLGMRKVTNKPTAKGVAQQTVREPDKTEEVSNEEPAISNT